MGRVAEYDNFGVAVRGGGFWGGQILESAAPTRGSQALPEAPPTSLDGLFESGKLSVDCGQWAWGFVLHIFYTPHIGGSINNNWANHVVALCGEDDGAVKRLCVESLKAFFGPDKPYVRGRIEIYERLIEAWGGVPDDLKKEFGRWLSRSNEEHQKAAVEVGIDIDSAPGSAQMIFSKMDAETLCERGVIIAGDPESCIKSAK